MANTHYKISFNLLESDFEMLDQLAKEQGITLADVIRKSLAMYDFMNTSVGNGSNILVEDKHHQMRKVIFQ